MSIWNLKFLLFFGFVFCFVSQFVFADSNLILEDIPPKSWYSLPNSKMRAICPTKPEGIFQGECDCICVIDDWSGGTYDPNHDKLIIWGGGHNDYYGNELYAFDLTTLSWELLTNPSVPASPANCAEVLDDGRPNTRHTYGGLAYLVYVDKLFAHGGSLACYNGTPSQKTWTFDLNEISWQDRNPTGDIPPYDQLDEYSVYDPESQLVYLFWHSRLFSYSYDENKWTYLDDDEISWPALSCTIDSQRGLLVEVGTGYVAVHDIKNKDYRRQIWNTTGSNEIINTYAPGLAYDPIADRIICWNGGPVYSLNMDTRIWEKIEAPGAPSSTPSGIFGRFRYLPKYNIFITVTGADENVHFYKNTEGGGITNIDNPTTSNIAEFAVDIDRCQGMINWSISNNPMIYSVELFREQEGKYSLLDKFQISTSGSPYFESSYIDSQPWLAEKYKLALYDMNNKLIEEKLVVNSPARINEFSMADPYPNPSEDKLNLVFQSPENVLLQFKVVDVLGRIVREFEITQYQKSWKQIVWDGRDVQGNSVAKGIYIIQVRAVSLKEPNKVLWQETKKISRLK